MTHFLSIAHTFEAAHRLPQLGGKCANLHGHSWSVEIHITADSLTGQGIIVDIGTVKQVWRAWIDAHLDHGAMLADDDPLVDALRLAGCKVYRFGASVGVGDYEEFARYLQYPTVESVAEVLFNAAHILLGPLLPPGAGIGSVHVREKHDNAAAYVPPCGPLLPWKAAA